MTRRRPSEIAREAGVPLPSLLRLTWLLRLRQERRNAWLDAYRHEMRCHDCKRDKLDLGHLLHNHVWTATGRRRRNSGQLCLECIEARLGRRLRLGDFRILPEVLLMKRASC
jgi:hypothetical protein